MVASQSIILKKIDHMHVTVCIPAYNASRTLQRTLDSIMSQDYPDFDVLVCDNSSTDNTTEIVRGYSDRGVRYFLNPVRTQCGENNWNHALSLAAGPLIALYHADDIYSPTMVRRQAEFLIAHPKASSVFTMTQMIDDLDRPNRMGIVRLPNALQGKELLSFATVLNGVLAHHNFMIVPTLMTRTDTLDAVGMFNPDDYSSAADIDLWLRMACWGPIGIIDEPLHRYRISPYSGTSRVNSFRTHLAHFYVVLDHYLSLPHVQTIVEPRAKSLYLMRRAVDQTICAMNLAVLGHLDDARIRLISALEWNHFTATRHEVRRLPQLLAGLCLLLAIRVGLGQCAGKILYHAYEWHSRWLRQPGKE